MLVLNGSARLEGCTGAAVRVLMAEVAGAAPIALCERRIAAYSYPPVRADDDFDAVFAALLTHNDIVFATPVYWYAMAGPLKLFFDRLTDVLDDPVKRPGGRALAGRRGWLLATGTDANLPAGFVEPFARTCAYLDMTWGGHLYVDTRDSGWLKRETNALQAFSRVIGSDTLRAAGTMS